MRSAFKNFMKNMSMGAVSVILFFIITEIVFRLFYGSPFLCNRHEKIAEVKGGDIKYVLMPNLDTLYAGKRLVTNSLGLRDYRPPHKTTDKTQILVLGDSYTFGFGVDAKDAFPFLLESLLNNHTGDARYEVINAGVPGYNTIQELELLKMIMPYYSPKWIVAAFTPNDSWTDSSIDIWEGASTALTRNKALFSLGAVLRYNSSFVTQLIRFYKLYLIEYISAHKSLFGFDLVGHNAASGLESAVRALMDIKKIADENNSGLVVFIVAPPMNWRAYPHGNIHAAIARFCADNSVYCVDLLEELRSHDPAGLWVAPCDEHYSPSANMIAAGMLFDFFSRH